MAILLLVFICLAFYHFILQSLILPAFKTETIFNIINLRSEFQRIAFTQNSHSNESIIMMSNIMAVSVNHFDDHNAFTIFFNALFKTNSITLGKEEKVIYHQVIELSKDSELKDTISMYRKEIGKIFLINSAGWLIYIIPLIPVLFLITLIVFIKKIIVHRTKLHHFRSSVSSIIALEIDHKAYNINTKSSIPMRVEPNVYYGGGRSYRNQTMECVI